MATKYKPIEKGLRGTDNCPVCGRAMEKSEASLFSVLEGKPIGVIYTRLICTGQGHEVLVLLSKGDMSR